MFDIIVPSESGEQNSIVARWYRKAGDLVKAGDLLCVVETNKATVDIIAPMDGYLLAILYQEGEEVPLHAPIARMGGAAQDPC